MQDIFSEYLNISTILIFIVLLLFTHFIWIHIGLTKLNIPGPRPWPIIGNLPMFWRVQNPNKLFLELREKYGDMVYFTLGSQPFILCYGYKIVHDVLVKNSDKTKHRPTWLRVFAKLFPNGAGVVFSNGKAWYEGRKFTQAALKDFGVGTKSIEGIIHEEIQYLIDIFSAKKSQPIKINEYFTKAASNVVSNVVFGSRFDYDDTEFNRILKNVQYVVEHNNTMRSDNFFPILELFQPSDEVSQIVYHFNEVNDYIRSRIEQHRETFDTSIIRNFLDLYIAQEGDKNSKISENFLFPTIGDLYFAGTDTTSVVMQWSMLYMLKYPDVQQKCRKEIFEVIGENRLPHLKDRENLPYVNATLHEIQRIETTAPVAVPHATLEDVYINEKFIPKKSILLCDLMSVHLDPAVWDEPNVFRPERFLDHNGKFVTKEAFCAFSMGPRQCLGKQLGEAEVFLFFVGFIQRFCLNKARPDQPLSTTGIQTFVTVEPQPFEMVFTQLN